MQATIAEQVEALRESETWARFLTFAQSFHRYSLGNLLLIFNRAPRRRTSPVTGRGRSSTARCERVSAASASSAAVTCASRSTTSRPARRRNSVE